MVRTMYIFDELMSALNLTNTLGWISTVLPKQQSAGRHIVPLGYIIFILSKPICALTP